MFVDESGIKEYIHRERGRALKGEKIYGEVSGKRFQGTNIIAGKCGKEIYAPIVYKNTTDTAFFNIWLTECLLPEIGKGKVIILDNASFHKNKRTKEIIEAAGCTLIYLPPYSPDLNPIEKFWSWLKRKIRSIVKNFASLEDTLIAAFAKWN